MNKTICLGMITKNESLNIKQTLEAVKPIIDYWIICDTGSTDRTKEIILETMKGIPGELIDRPWINFGYNRSEVAILTKDKADYSLMLDADFTVELNGFNKEYLINDQYDLLIKWVGTGFYNPLLFSNKLSWHSVGVVHEYWYADGIKSRSKLPSLNLNHDRHGAARPKGIHDLKLLEQGVIDEPNNARYRFYLANTYRDVGEYKKAIDTFIKRISMGGWDEEVFYSKYQIGYCYELMNEIDKAKIAYLEAWEFRPSRAEPLCKLAAICRKKGEYQQAYFFAKKGMDIPYPNDIIFVDRPTYEYALRFERSIAAYWIGKYEEAIEDCKIIDRTENVNEDVKKVNRQNIGHSEKFLFTKEYLITKFPGEEHHSFLPFNSRTDKLISKNLQDMIDIEKLFFRNFNLELYLIYGTLLGAIRNNNFIPDDNDIDFAYISKFHTEEEVKKEVTEMAWVLRHQGLLVKCHKNGGQLRVSSPDKKTVVDIWTSWIENDEYHIIPRRKIGNKNDIFPLIKKELKGYNFNIPNNSEKILDSLYINWKTSLPKKSNYNKSYIERYLS